jgi:hypothetical protein
MRDFGTSGTRRCTRSTARHGSVTARPATQRFRPEFLFSRQNDQRRVVVKGAGGEAGDCVCESGLQRGSAARAVGPCDVDEARFAEFFVGGAARFGDPVSEEDQPIAGR